MKFLVLIASAIVAIVADSGQSGINWCKIQAETCGPTNRHIACVPNQLVSADDVSNLKLITLTKAQKYGILKQHNTYRNSLAAGTYAQLGYPSAAQMGEMKWDSTLEYLASLHASRGVGDHDECHNTRKYRSSGQSLNYLSTNATKINVSEGLTSTVDGWFNEVKIAKMSGVVDEYISPYHRPAGHFSVMVNDRNNRIGCAASTMDTANGTWHGLLLTCNYGYDNIIGSFTYIKGPPLKGCKTPASKTYRNLCST